MHRAPCAFGRRLVARFALPLLLGIAMAAPALADCGGDTFYGYLVKQTYESYYYVATIDCSGRNTTREIVSVSWTPAEEPFIASPAVTIWPQSNDPRVHTAAPLRGEIADADGVPANGTEARFVFSTRSLRDLGTYVYWW